MRSLLTSTALAGLLTVSAAFAQDAEYDASTVLADVDGTEITLGHLIATYDRLPENYRSIPAEQVFPGTTRTAHRPDAGRKRTDGRAG